MSSSHSPSPWPRTRMGAYGYSPSKDSKLGALQLQKPYHHSIRYPLSDDTRRQCRRKCCGSSTAVSGSPHRVEKVRGQKSSHARVRGSLGSHIRSFNFLCTPTGFTGCGGGSGVRGGEGGRRPGYLSDLGRFYRRRGEGASSSSSSSSRSRPPHRRRR